VSSAVGLSSLRRQRRTGACPVTTHSPPLVYAELAELSLGRICEGPGRMCVLPGRRASRGCWRRRSSLGLVLRWHVLAEGCLLDGRLRGRGRRGGCSLDHFRIGQLNGVERSVGVLVTVSSNRPANLRQLKDVGKEYRVIGPCYTLPQ
jgi:hypothetical protein